MNKYEKLKGDKMEEHLSNYIIERLSPSCISTFLRNELAFMQSYICKDYDNTSSVSCSVGKVYHKVLENFFEKYKKDKSIMSIEEMKMMAFDELDKISDRNKRLGKNKTLDNYNDESNRKINQLLENFEDQKEYYLKDIKEIVGIETVFNVFLTFNDYDVPLPFKFISDLIYRNTKDQLCIVDHKSVSIYTQKEDMPLKYGVQALINKRGVEQFYDEKVKSVNFYENKATKNRDHTDQIVKMDSKFDELKDYYEMHLEISCKKIIRAVSDPDYNYLPNPYDNFVNKEGIVNFYLSTLEEDEGIFDKLNDRQKKLLKKRKHSAKKISLQKTREVLLKEFYIKEITNENMDNMSPSEKISFKLRCLGYKAKVMHIIEGSSTDSYLLQVADGMKIDSIHRYKSDIAAGLGKTYIRINPELVEYEDEIFVEIQVPKKERSFPKTKNMSTSFQIGEDNFGAIYSWNPENPSTPHLMIAGASGSGKSVAIKNIISQAEGWAIEIIDPKYEFSNADLHEQAEIEVYFEVLVKEIDHMFKNGKKTKKIIIFDEVADCLAKQTKKDVVHTLEDNIMIIAQKA